VKPGFSPLDEQLELTEKHWSEGVSKLSVYLSGITDFEQAAEVLERVGRIHSSSGSVWGRTKKWGEVFKKEEEKERAQAETVDEKHGVVPGEEKSGPRMGAGMDGVMVNIREEGWKETKVGCLFEVGRKREIDPQTQEEVEVGCALKNTYVAHLGGPEVFGQAVWAEARRRHWTAALDTQVLGDGAVWIWNLAGEHFYDSQQGVDWYHAKEHLANAALLLHGEGTPAMHRWLNEQETTLFQGHAEEVAQKITADATPKDTAKEALLREAGYFENNKRRMDYLEMRIQGWVIGSGMVESGGKQYKARLTGPGMQWSRSGAERLLPIRSAILSGRFDELWRRAINSPQN
jgi:hypothetical protein